MSVSSFGLTGDGASRPGHDLVFQAMAGLLDGPPGVVPVVDMVSGFLTVIGALAAIAGRSRDGKARTVETAMFDGALALNTFALTRELAGLPARPRPGMCCPRPGHGDRTPPTWGADVRHKPINAATAPRT